MKKNIPQPFVKWLEYATHLTFSEVPSYAYLRELLSECVHTDCDAMETVSIPGSTMIQQLSELAPLKTPNQSTDMKSKEIFKGQGTSCDKPTEERNIDDDDENKRKNGELSEKEKNLRNFAAARSLRGDVAAERRLASAAIQLAKLQGATEISNGE